MKRMIAALALLPFANGSAAAWMKREFADRITDAKTTLVEQYASSTLLLKPREPEKTTPQARLVIQCAERRLSVFVYIDRRLVAGSSRNEVTYRFDNDAPIKSAAWIGSTDSSGIGLWETAPTMKFLRMAKGKTRLRFRQETVVFGVTEGDFDISGIDDAAAEPIRACK